MKESKNNTILNKYLREKRLYCYYELKIAKGETFPFSKMEVNQDESLMALSKEGLVWKFSDEDSRKKPCDGGCFPPLPAYLVIKFGLTFYFVSYAEIKKMMAHGNRSITKDECIMLSTYIVHT